MCCLEGAERRALQVFATCLDTDSLSTTDPEVVNSIVAYQD